VPKQAHLLGFYAPSQFFLWESGKAAQPGENTEKEGEGCN